MNPLNLTVTRLCYLMTVTRLLPYDSDETVLPSDSDETVLPSDSDETVLPYDSDETVLPFKSDYTEELFSEPDCSTPLRHLTDTPPHTPTHFTTLPPLSTDFIHSYSYDMMTATVLHLFLDRNGNILQLKCLENSYEYVNVYNYTQTTSE